MKTHEELLFAANELAIAASIAACKSRDLYSTGDRNAAQDYLRSAADSGKASEQLVREAFKVKLMLLILPNIKEKK